MNIASPSRWEKYFQTYMPYMRQMMEPERVRNADALAIGAQEGRQALDTSAARRGLLGSGFHLAGQQAIEGQRRSALTEADVNYFLEALRGASGLAERTQDRKIGALYGAPFLQGGSNKEPFTNFLGSYGRQVLSMIPMMGNGGGGGTMV